MCLRQHSNPSASHWRGTRCPGHRSMWTFTFRGLWGGRSALAGSLEQPDSEGDGGARRPRLRLPGPTVVRGGGLASVFQDNGPAMIPNPCFECEDLDDSVWFAITSADQGAVEQKHRRVRCASA